MDGRAMAGVPMSSVEEPRAMPRQRIRHRRDTLDLLDDFPERLRRLQAESRMSCRRPPGAGSRAGPGPTSAAGRALPELADGMALGHLLTDNGDTA